MTVPLVVDRSKRTAWLITYLKNVQNKISFQTFSLEGGILSICHHSFFFLYISLVSIYTRKFSVNTE